MILDAFHTNKNSNNNKGSLGYMQKDYLNNDLEESDIIVKFIEESYTFEKKTFSKYPKLALSILETEYEEVITNCSKLVGKSLIEKKENDRIDFPSIQKIMTIILFCLLITLFAILSQAMSRHSNKSALFAVAVVLFVIIVLISAPLTIYNWNYEIRSFKNLSYFIIKNINSYLQEINRKYDGSLQFYIHDNGSQNSRYLWIRLLDSKKNK